MKSKVRLPGGQPVGALPQASQDTLTAIGSVDCVRRHGLCGRSVGTQDFWRFHVLEHAQGYMAVLLQQVVLADNWQAAFQFFRLSRLRLVSLACYAR